MTKPITITVLVVDDDQTAAMLASSFLRQAGYTVSTAHSGEEALGLVRAGHKITLLLTDVLMPGISGPELAAEILRLSKDVRILLMSAGTPDQLEEYWAFGSGYPLLPKPLTAASLLAAVRHCVG